MQHLLLCPVCLVSLNRQNLDVLNKCPPRGNKCLYHAGHAPAQRREFRLPEGFFILRVFQVDSLDQASEKGSEKRQGTHIAARSQRGPVLLPGGERASATATQTLLCRPTDDVEQGQEAGIANAPPCRPPEPDFSHLLTPHLNASHTSVSAPPGFPSAQPRGAAAVHGAARAPSAAERSAWPSAPPAPPHRLRG